MTDITWCVVHTQPTKELVAKKHLKEQGYTVYAPRFEKIRRHARKVDHVLAPLFPRYIFVGLNLEKVSWRTINATRGVSYLLMRDHITPARISQQVIDDLKEQEIDDEILPISSLDTFYKGERVRIVDGAFKNMLATYQHLDDKGRVQVLLTFMGRDMKIPLSMYAVEAA